MSEDAGLDMAMVESLQGLLGPKFTELVEAFVSDGARRMDKLKQAAEGPDLEQIRSEAHGLKGSCRNLGANALADVCADIEDRAHKGDSGNLEQNLASAEQLFADVSQCLTAMLDA